MTQGQSRRDFGSRVLGPVLAEFSLKILMFARALPPDSQLLFCARGGLRIRAHFEQFLARIGQVSPVPWDDLMVSRLAAARRPLLKRSPAAIEEISREFEGSTMGMALLALSQTPAEISRVSGAPFDMASLLRLLEAEEGESVRVRGAITEQAELFEEHFLARRRAKHVVLCDTGLYGSTLRLMEAAFPEIHLACVLFARANYKGFPQRHFSRTMGLMVERDTYSPFDARSVALRYWHLIEHVYEPPIESVKLFTRDANGNPISNLEGPGWREWIAPDDESFFAGAMDYLTQLTPDGYGDRLARDVPRAWGELKRRISRPREADLALLDVGPRGRDFGRGETVNALSRGETFSLSSLRGGLWREGEAARAPLGLRASLQLGLEAARIAKYFRREAFLRVKAGRAGA